MKKIMLLLALFLAGCDSGSSVRPNDSIRVEDANSKITTEHLLGTHPRDGYKLIKVKEGKKEYLVLLYIEYSRSGIVKLDEWEVKAEK